MSGYRPEWDIDLSYGEDGESMVRHVLGLSTGKVEVKRKRRVDDRFYVETAQSPGATGRYKASGINVSTASRWAYVIADTGVVLFIPRLLLKAAATSGKRAEERDGNNPTKGRLVSFGEILAANVAEAERPDLAVVPSPEPAEWEFVLPTTQQARDYTETGAFIPDDDGWRV